MSTLNLGILAHVDAGKTSLTERLLHAAGVIDQPGSVDDGNTRTDTLELERRRGITIKAAVVSFDLGGVTVNLIDTPGHPDFIAEVERVLGVLDGAVLVVSAVEGVQAQTRVLMRALRRLDIPTLIFVNKIDRGGADRERVLRGLREKLTDAIVPMGTVLSAGTADAAFAPFPSHDAEFTAAAIDVLADHDDAFLADYLADENTASPKRLRLGLAELTGKAAAHPVFFGSAITGAGIEELTVGIRELLPSTSPTPDSPAGAVFKVERGRAGEKIAYLRMFSGTVHTRDRLTLHRAGTRLEGKITAISVFEHGTDIRHDAVTAGHIGKVWGLTDVQIGDAVGEPHPGKREHHFSPPTLETVVVPIRRAEKGKLHAALAQLAEQDPLIDLRQDDVRQELYVSLYGEVQKEVIEATLAEEYGIEVGFRESTTIHIERPVGSGSALEVIKKNDNPFLATVGLRIDPGDIGSGIRFRLEVELGAMPYAFFKAVEDTVHETLRQGLHGWQVMDCVVTMTHSGYWPRQSHMHARFDKSMSSTGADFRSVTPLVLMDALRTAQTKVYEPVHRFRLDIPADSLGPILPILAALRAVPQSSHMRGPTCLLEGEIPAAQVNALERQLPGLTGGEGVFEYEFDHYEPVRDEVPQRPRSDHNPLDRKEYLLHVQRRV
ncbi:MAG TPA: translation factor GTPase family protein [Actinocrinis sp.]|nr:translation factor GTPase family protein [Actinocrinis sp.]